VNTGFKPRAGLRGRLQRMALPHGKARKMVLGMDKGRHPKVVRTWMTGKTRKPPLIPKVAPVAPHKPEPHNKT